jgi:AraC-like DNA-binding protein
VKDLLAISNLSRPTLVTKFRETFGIHPSEEIRRVRLNAAKQMLAGSRVSILEVSQKCGFQSQTSFPIFSYVVLACPHPSIEGADSILPLHSHG